MTIERLRTLYGLVLDRSRPNEAARISVERILALVERRGGIANRLATLDSVMRSRESIAEMEILRSAIGSRPAARALFGQPLGAALSALAATVVLAVGITVGTHTWRNRADASRGGNTPVVQLVTPTESVSAHTIKFTWKPVRDAREYEIEVLDADGLSAFVSTVQGTTVQLPASVRLIPGAEYRWWVVAKRGDGSRVGAIPRRLRIDDGTNGSGADA